MPASRVCPTPGCPAFMPCAEHARPSSNARGYTHQHRKTRAAWLERVQAGVVKCWRCRELIKPDEAWHLGHDDLDRSITRGPEHVACNLGAAGHSSQDRYRE